VMPGFHTMLVPVAALIKAVLLLKRNNFNGRIKHGVEAGHHRTGDKSSG